VARKAKVIPMVKGNTLMKYLANLAKDGTGYVIHFYPKDGEAFIDHNFDESDEGYKREVAVDLMNTAYDLIGIEDV
jgi:hypothetical protein